MRLRGWPWLAGLLSIAVAALWFSNTWLTAPLITNDSYQYLDTASSVASGGCLCIGMAHFDEQVAAGRLPVAQNALPAWISASHRGPVEAWAADLRSCRLRDLGGRVSSFAVLLIWDRRMHCWRCSQTRRSAIAALLWILNSSALTYAAAVLTESAFTAVVAALVALVARDLKSERGNPRSVAAGPRRTCRTRIQPAIRRPVPHPASAALSGLALAAAARVPALGARGSNCGLLLHDSYSSQELP